MLVGAAIGTFYPDKLWLLPASLFALLIKVGSEKLFDRIKLPQLTFPFVLTTWILFLLFPVTPASKNFSVMELYGHSPSQVFLVGSFTSSLLVVIGLLISSRRAVLLTLIAPLSSLLVSACFKTQVFGFSAILTAVALGDVFNKNMRYSTLFVALVLTSLLQIALNSFFVGLTFPFIFITWAFLLLSKPRQVI